MAVWESIVGTVVGGSIGALGTWFGVRLQARADRDARRELYLREDAVRNLELRMGLYAQYLASANDLHSACVDHSYAIDIDDEDRRLASTATESKCYGEVRKITDQVELVASSSVVDATTAVLRAYDHWAPVNSPDAIDQAISGFVRAVRNEIGRDDVEIRAVP